MCGQDSAIESGSEMRYSTPNQVLEQRLTVPGDEEVALWPTLTLFRSLQSNASEPAAQVGRGQ